MTALAIPGAVTRQFPWPNGPQTYATVHYVSAAEFRQHQAELLNRVEYKNEFVVVLKNYNIKGVVIPADSTELIISILKNIPSKIKCVRKQRDQKTLNLQSQAAA